MKSEKCEYKRKILSEITYIKEIIKKFDDEINELEKYVVNSDATYVFYSLNKERSVVNNRISVLRNDLVKFRKLLYGKD